MRRSNVSGKGIGGTRHTGAKHGRPQLSTFPIRVLDHAQASHNRLNLNLHIYILYRQSHIVCSSAGDMVFIPV